MKRINLYISDELYEAIERNAKLRYLKIGTYVKQKLHELFK